MPNLTADIDSYLNSVGLRSHRNINQFWSYLDSRYPRDQICDLERAYAELEKGNESSFYAEIFQNVKVSIDFSSLRRDLYRAYLDWFVQSVTECPNTIVDVGCGNGILTCFYAQHFPMSKVIGFDISEGAIDCAKDVASQIGVSNVEFVVSDANDPSLPVEKGAVDLLVSVAALGPPPLAGTANAPVYDLLSAKPKMAALIQVSLLAPYLEPAKGKFISFDKVGNLAAQASWANIIQRSGLGINLAESSWIGYQNIEDDTITLPALVATPYTPPTSAHDLISFFINNNNDLSQWCLDFGQEGLAELVFTFINPKTFLSGAKAVHNDGSGVYWYELWQAGPFLLVYEHTDQGFRTVRTAPSTRRPEFEDAVKDWVEQSTSYAEVTILTEPDVRFETKA